MLPSRATTPFIFIFFYGAADHRGLPVPTHSSPTRRSSVLADLRQHRHLVADGGDSLEEFDRVFDGHVEHVGDRLAIERHLQRLAVVALAVADVAGDVDIGEEVHFYLDQAVAGAGIAPPALDGEAEPAGPVAARLGVGQDSETIAAGGSRKN